MDLHSPSIHRFGRWLLVSGAVACSGPSGEAEAPRDSDTSATDSNVEDAAHDVATFDTSGTDTHPTDASDLDSTPPIDGGCTTPPPSSALVGWAAVSGTLGGVTVATTTGGAGGADLTKNAGGTDARILQISGTITGDVTIGSNKTLAHNQSSSSGTELATSLPASPKFCVSTWR